MLVPLAIGLVVKGPVRRHGRLSAARLEPDVEYRADPTRRAHAQVLNFQNVLSVIGTGAIFALLLFVVVLVRARLGARCPWQGTTVRSWGCGTAQRNVSAAPPAVGAQNFGEPDVLVMLIVGAIVMLVVLLPPGGELTNGPDRPSKHRRARPTVRQNSRLATAPVATVVPTDRRTEDHPQMTRTRSNPQRTDAPDDGMAWIPGGTYTMGSEEFYP